MALAASLEFIVVSNALCSIKRPSSNVRSKPLCIERFTSLRAIGALLASTLQYASRSFRKEFSGNNLFIIPYS